MWKGVFVVFKKLKRCCNKAKQRYSNEVQKYLKSNGFILVQKIYDGVLGTGKLEEKKVKEILGANYPVNPWISESDIIGQFVSIMEQAGYQFSRDSSGEVHFKHEELYSAIVQNHLRFSGKEILERLGDCCQKTSGRITYEEMHEILGFHYPKAPYVVGVDNRVGIILFLREVGLPFKFDETHIYLP